MNRIRALKAAIEYALYDQDENFSYFCHKDLGLNSEEVLKELNTWLYNIEKIRKNIRIYNK